MKVAIPNECVVCTLHCGGDGTAVITTDGVLMACGRNLFNKLGLDDTDRGFFPFNLKVSFLVFLTLLKEPGYQNS
jgi:alpha-tubulin suppressor-like RCC1 family protein